jgi:hypothetical protein
MWDKPHIYTNKVKSQISVVLVPRKIEKHQINPVLPS